MQCPHCQLTMQDAPHLAGQPVACPQCGGQFVVPGQQQEQFDPYYNWLGIPPAEQPANHYRLLGLQLFESNPSVIDNAADRQMKHLQSFKIGAKAAFSQRLLTEVSAARVQLLDPTRKAAYDSNLRGQVGGQASAQPCPPGEAYLIPQLPQLPEAGTSFASVPDSINAASMPSRSGVRRIGRRSDPTSFLAWIWIIVGGGVGLAIGVLIIFYLTGQDFLGLSGKLKQQQSQAEVKPKKQPGTVQKNGKPPGMEEWKQIVAPNKPKKIEPPSKRETSGEVPVSPQPVVVQPLQMELFAQAPRFLRLPSMTSSAPESWFSLTHEPMEPLTFSLHVSAATLQASTTLRIQAIDRDLWNVQQASDLPGMTENVTVGQIRRDGLELSFAWTSPPADIEVRRQLSNCLLEITHGTEFRTIQLREPLTSSPFLIELDGDKKPVEFDVAATPPSSKLFVRVRELVAFIKGGKLRGDATTALSKPVVIEFTELKGAELELRFVRQTTGKIAAQLKPTYVEAANRKYELTIPSLDKLYDAQKKVAQNAQATVNTASSNLKVAQNTLQQLQANRPTNIQELGSWQQRVVAASAAVDNMNRAIRNANENLAEANVRLSAVPEMRQFIQSLNENARVKFEIVAKSGEDEIVLVDATGQ